MADPKAVEKTGLAEKEKHHQVLEDWEDENVENNGQPRPVFVTWDDNDDEEKEEVGQVAAAAGSYQGPKHMLPPASVAPPSIRDTNINEYFNIRHFDVYDDTSIGIRGGDSNGGGGTVRGSDGKGSVDAGDRKEEAAIGEHKPSLQQKKHSFNLRAFFCVPKKFTHITIKRP